MLTDEMIPEILADVELFYRTVLVNHLAVDILEKLVEMLL